MTSRLAVAGLVAGALSCASAAAAGPRAPGPARAYAATRPADRRPSLEGVWSANFILTMEATPKTPTLTVSEAEAKAMAAASGAALADATDKELDPELPGLIRATDGLPIVRGQRRTRAVVEPADGRLPYTPQARKEYEGPPKDLPLDNPENRPDSERCLVGLGPPPMSRLIYVNRLQIVQTRDHVVLHTEYGDEVRIIPLTDTHGLAALGTRLGDSIARWDGDTLVIETTGLPDSYRRRSFPTLLVPGGSTVIERLTRVSKDELNYQFTVVEPKTYAGPWLAEFSWFKSDQPMFESACHEGNYSLPNILAGARHDEAVAKAAATAARPRVRTQRSR
jgi:hypothetical protein